MAEQSAMSGSARLPLRDTYDSEDLPAYYRALLDPQRPLPPAVGFFPGEANILIFVVALSATCILILCGVFAILGNIAENRGQAVRDYSLITVAFFCFVFAFAGGLTVRSQFGQMRTRLRGGLKAPQLLAMVRQWLGVAPG